MISIQRIFAEIQNYHNRHLSLKEHFNNFQNSIIRLGGDGFRVSGFRVETKSDTESSVFYIDREYRFRFSSHKGDNTLKGKITAFRVSSESESFELGSVAFNGQSIVDIDPPEGEIQEVRLDHENDCLALVLNWICNEINAQSGRV